MDKKSPYYIYKVSNGVSNSTSDYVIKMSPVMAQIAIDMKVDGPQNILQKENAHFHTTFCRVCGFSSFGLWFYHPSMHNIAIFFNHIIIREALSKVKAQKNYSFNLRAFVCDEGGANYKAIRMVY